MFENYVSAVKEFGAKVTEMETKGPTAWSTARSTA